MSERELLVGIDEAGYGPILGPLTVSAAAFEGPESALRGDLWRLLTSVVSKRPVAMGGKISILDSKKLHKAGDGIGRLERSALTAVTVWRGLPPSLTALCKLICPDLAAMTRDYGWYRESDPTLPRRADEGGIRITAKLFGDGLAKAGVQIAGVWSEVLPEGHYNRLVGGTQNKATVLMGLTLRLVQRVANSYPGHRIRFFVDKQGARDRYAPLLMRAFENRRLKVIEESPERSAYELSGDGASWRIGFEQAGESHHLAVALASIMSKYLRELFMGCFNAYWRERVPNLRPTAGYYEDGLRFLRDIEPHLKRLGVLREQLVRQR